MYAMDDERYRASEDVQRTKTSTGIRSDQWSVIFDCSLRHLIFFSDLGRRSPDE